MEIILPEPTPLKKKAATFALYWKSFKMWKISNGFPALRSTAPICMPCFDLSSWSAFPVLTPLDALPKRSNFCFPPPSLLFLFFLLLRWAHLQGRCLLKRKRGRMSLLHHGVWACEKPAVTEHWQKSAQLKTHKKRRTQLGWCARPLLLASHPHWTIRTKKRSTRI